MDKKSVENDVLNETTINVQILNDNEKNDDVTNELLKDNNSLITKKNNENQIINMLKILFCDVSNETEGYTNKTFAFLTSLILRIFGYLLLIVGIILFIGTPIYFVISYEWNNVLEGILTIFYIVFIVICSFLMSVLLVGTAKEQEGKDYNATIPVFSAIVSFIALIISLVALIK